MRILMIGQRGVPATFGGIERAVEEVGAELVQRGHEVEVLCRRGYTEVDLPTYRGMKLRYLPTLDSKHLEAFVHTGLGAVTALPRHFDVVHYHALGPGLFSPLTRLFSSAAVVQTIHGLDDERAKWGGFSQRVLRFGAWTSAHVPHATIAVSRDLLDTYAKRWQRVVHYVPNGVREPKPVEGAALIGERFDLEPDRYLLFVGRLVPEKAVDHLLRAFRDVDTSMRLVIAGSSSHTDDYVATLEELAAQDPRVLLAGYVFGDTLQELYANATAFVLPSLLEGLPLSLLEAASHGTPVVVSDIAPHVEILGCDGPGRRFSRAGDVGSLRASLERALADPAREREAAAVVRRQVLGTYQWSAVASQTEAVYREAMARRG